jgi:uncharacterized membrane protein YagU involved in acid resistance
MASATTNPGRGSSSPVRSILIAGLVIGVVGGLDQTTFFILTQHFTPVSIFQFIASGLLGPAAFAGGYTTALVGLLIHFVISFVVAGVFILAATTIAFLRRTVWISALVYGAAVNFFMSALVLPMSGAPKMPVTPLLVAHGLIADALFVGLPLAILVWRDARTSDAHVNKAA